MSGHDPRASAGGELAESAEALAHLDAGARAEAFRALPTERRLAVFELLDPALQHELLLDAEPGEAAQLVEWLQPDDRARLFEEIPDEDVQALRARLSPRQRWMTDQLLAYGPESAGRIMTPEFIALRQGMPAARALDEVRARGRDAETIHVLPVLDEGSTLVGMVTLEELVLAQPDLPVSELMDTDYPVAAVTDDQELVARRIQEADVLAVPVVDPVGRLVGIVTIDDAMDVLELEESEDRARAGGTEPLGRPYLAVSMLQIARSRILWLLLLAVAATLTVNVLSAFEDVLDQVVTLSLFIPLLIGVGGNAGAQAATTVVRALAVSEVRFGDLLRVLGRECQVGLVLGLTLAAIGFLPMDLVFGLDLAAVVSLSLVAICTLGALVGSMMPLVASRLGIDPAVVSAPFVTTIVDASGLLVYFLIARAILGI